MITTFSCAAARKETAEAGKFSLDQYSDRRGVADESFLGQERQQRFRLGRPKTLATRKEARSRPL